MNMRAGWLQSMPVWLVWGPNSGESGYMQAESNSGESGYVQAESNSGESGYRAARVLANPVTASA